MTKKQLKSYYLLLIRYYKLSLLNQFLKATVSWLCEEAIFPKKFFSFIHFSTLLKCHWPVRAGGLKSHLPTSRIYSPLATGRVLMKRLVGPPWLWQSRQTSADVLMSSPQKGIYGLFTLEGTRTEGGVGNRTGIIRNYVSASASNQCEHFCISIRTNPMILVSFLFSVPCTVNLLNCPPKKL